MSCLLQTLCQNYTSQNFFLPLVFSHGALPFREDEELGGDQMKLKAFPHVPKRGFI